MYKTRKHSHYDLQGDLNRIRNAFADTAYDIKGKAGEVLNDSYQNTKSTFTNFVYKKPLKSLGIAAFAGFILGLLFHR